MLTYLEFGMAHCSKNLHETGLTHVVVSEDDLSRLPQIRAQLSMYFRQGDETNRTRVSGRLPRVVLSKWVLDSVKEVTRLDEARYAPWEQLQQHEASIVGSYSGAILAGGWVQLLHLLVSGSITYEMNKWSFTDVWFHHSGDQVLVGDPLAVSRRDDILRLLLLWAQTRDMFSTRCAPE